MRSHATTSAALSLALCFTAVAQDPLPVPVGRPAAVIDLMKPEGAQAFNAQWRYSDARLVETAFNAPGKDGHTPGAANITYEISPRAGEANFDDSKWEVIAADSLGERRAGGKVCFNWYRINLTMPARVDGFETVGATAVLNVTVDDYAEVWVNGHLPRALNQPNPNLVQGFNAPNRVTIAQDVKPGDAVQIAIFGINGPISAAPTNYIWFREAKVEFFPKPHALAPRPAAALEAIVANDVAGAALNQRPVESVRFESLAASPRAWPLVQWEFNDRAVHESPRPFISAHAMRTESVGR